MLVAYIRKGMRTPRAWPGGRLDGQNGTLIPGRVLSPGLARTRSSRVGGAGPAPRRLAGLKPSTAAVNADSGRMMVAGLSESCVPLFAAFAFLSVAWLLVAVGMRRTA